MGSLSLNATDHDSTMIDPAEMTEEQTMARLEADRMKVIIQEHFLSMLQGAKAAMQKPRRKWARYYRRYDAEQINAKDTGPFRDIEPPQLAPMVDLFVAQLMALVMPDRNRLDNFRITPADTGELAIPPQDQVKYCELIEAALRNDQRQADLPDELEGCLKDFAITGNMAGWVPWEMDIQNAVDEVDNPEYNPMLSPEQNCYWNEAAQAIEPIPPTVLAMSRVFEFDAPATRGIPILNLYPTELDVLKGKNCEGFFIYDTARLFELQQEEIANGGHLYANLHELTDDDECMDTPETEGNFADGTGYAGHDEINTGAVPKLARHTYVGRLRIKNILRKGGMEECSEAAYELLYEEFGMDRLKATGGWQTYIVELINEQTMVRCQPLPRAVDKNPVVVSSLYKSRRKLLGKGMYDRGVHSERICNALERFSLEHIMRMVRPMIGVDRSMIDNRWRGEKGDSLKYVPDGIIELRAGANAQQAMQRLSGDPTALNALDGAMARQTLLMGKLAHQPAVRLGAGGAQTATADKSADSSADELMGQIAQGVENMFLRPLLGWQLILHHQFTKEGKVLTVRAEDAELRTMEIPADVWTRMYHVEMTGYKSVGNAAVRAMNFKEYAGWLQSVGCANIEALNSEWAKIQNVRDGQRFYQKPPEPDPMAEMRKNFTMSDRVELLPPSVHGKILEAIYGFKLTPEDFGAMGAIYEAQKAAADLATANANPMAGGGQPMAKPVTAGGNGQRRPDDPNRSHHAPGEQENRQRGLHDEQGVNRSAGQQMRSPLSDRAALLGERT